MASLPHSKPRSPGFERLSQQLAGQLFTPSDPNWDRARRAWNLAVDQQPAAVALPGSAEEVAAVVRFAAENGLQIAPQGTGHSAEPLGSLEGTILLKTERMRGVEIEAGARTARVEAGVLSLEVVQAAAQHGLAALAGSSPDVGVVGYTLGGGISWLGRKYGLSANNVEAVELVTADGRSVRADRDSEPELFWAVRGGGGSFAVVTALELRLFPITEVYAGILWWPIEQGPEVLQAWGELTRHDLPEELTTVGRYLQLPPITEIPEPIRGKSFVVVEAIYLGEPAEADELLAPLRALGPAMDTTETIPVHELSRLHMDPDQPTPMIGDGLMLAELPASAVDELVRVAGAGSGSPLLSVELRHLGGELGRARPGNGALASLEAQYLLFALGALPSRELEAALVGHIEALKQALAPWTARHMYLNFAETSRDPRSLWSEEAYHRLRRVKAHIDPTNIIRSNHQVPPARG